MKASDLRHSSSMKALRRALKASGAALLVTAGGLYAAPIASAVEIYKAHGTTVEFTTEIGFGGFNVSQDYNLFGLANRKPLDDVAWAEGYAIMGFKFERALNANWSVFGTLTGVVNGVRGDGDAVASTIGEEDGAQLQDASGGVKWTDGREGGASITLSGGRQKWVLGDGFLIAGDQPSSGIGYGAQYNEGGAYYLNPRRVFGQTAIANIETGTPLRFDAFYIESEKGWNGKRAIAGGNVDYVDKIHGTLGFTYIRGLDVQDPQNTVLPFTPASDGMNLYSIHGNSSLGVKDFNLSFNYVSEKSGAVDVCATPVQCQGLDAWAWYIKPSYTFSDATWTPSVYYRFASYSGDDPTTTKNEGYDTLFYGATGYNGWFIGEIAANYSGPFSQNADVHSIGLSTVPNIDIGIGKWTGLSGYINHYSVRETAPGTDSNWGTELAAYAEFQLFEKLYLAPLYSVLLPEKGYEAAYGTDDTVHNFQIIGILTY